MIRCLAIAWALFQWALVFSTLNDTIARSIHLCFALALGFLIFPFRRHREKPTLPTVDILLATLAGLGALYLVFDFEGIALRPGLPLGRDIIIGIATIVLLLEASRRSLGMAMSIIAVVFIVYCFAGPYMPGMLAHRGVSIAKLVNHMYLTTEGIFGVPLRVSTSFIYLFVLFGALLEQAGASKYFIKLAYTLFGHFRGGPAKAAVAASGLTGMVSGSSIANTVTTGTFTIPLMKKMGLPATKAAAIEVAASTNGQLMPPIMGAAAFIMAEFLGVAYVDVIKAALIPALVAIIGLFYVVHLEAVRYGIKRVPKDEIDAFWPTFVRGSYYFFPVVALIYALAVKKYSPSLSVFHAINATILILAIKLILQARIEKAGPLATIIAICSSLMHACVRSAKNMIPISIATAAAGIIVGTVTLTGLGQTLLELAEIVSLGNVFLILLFTAVASLVLGMGLPTTATYIVMASLTAPIVIQFGANAGVLFPAIAIHLFVFYFGILADDTPPVGLAAYAAAAIAESEPIRTGIQAFRYDVRTAILPFMFMFNTELLLIDRVDFTDWSAGLTLATDSATWHWSKGIWGGLMVFATAAIGMCAFVSAVTGYAINPCKWWERLILLVISFALFQPTMVAKWVMAPQAIWISLAAVGIYICLLTWQTRLANKNKTVTHS